MPTNERELLQEIIDVYARLKNSPDFQYFLKEATAILGKNNNLRRCKNFEEYQYKQGYMDGMERTINLSDEMIKIAIKELNKEEV